MPHLKRRRHGPIAAIDQRCVQIADYQITFDSYRDRLELNHDIVMSRVAARSTVTPKLLDQASSALVCGRIIKANSAQPDLYERVEYCRQTRLCLCCYAAARAHSAAMLVNGTPQLVGSRLLHFVFTTPQPYTDHEEALYAAQAVCGMKCIHDVICTHKRRVGDIYRVPTYALGLHTKANPDTGLLWSHIHLGMAVNPLGIITGSDGWAASLQKAYLGAFDTSARPLIKYADLGIIQPDRQCREGRKHVSITRTKNLLAYVIRNTEPNDTHQAIARRDQLHQLIGLDTTHILSRRSRGETAVKKSRPPHQFPPGQLGNTQTYMFAFDGRIIAIKPASAPAVQKRLLAEATALLDNRFIE